jgi:hypothetical protein
VCALDWTCPAPLGDGQSRLSSPSPPDTRKIGFVRPSSPVLPRPRSNRRKKTLPVMAIWTYRKNGTPVAGFGGASLRYSPRRPGAREVLFLLRQRWWQGHHPPGHHLRDLRPSCLAAFIWLTMRAPRRELQGPHIGLRFDRSCQPPRRNGTTWSAVVARLRQPGVEHRPPDSARTMRRFF